MDNIKDITSAQQLMLQACISSSKEVQENFVLNWEKWVIIEDIDFSSMRLAPLFLHKNQQSGIVTKHDKRLKIIYKYWWLKTQHIFNQLKTVHEAFFAKNVYVVLLKGASIMTYYELPELRPMADFDLLIHPGEIKSVFDILKGLGYVPERAKETILHTHPRLVLDFQHSIEFTHTLTGTKLDLHWKVGSLCSQQFTINMRQHLESYEALPGAKKPTPAYEAFMVVIHGVEAGSRDNLNWIIDIDILNTRTERSFWDEARQIAVVEKKEDMFDYGCNILLQNGVYACKPKTVKKNIPLVDYISADDKKHLGKLYLYSTTVKKFILFTKYLFAHSNMPEKCYQFVRCIRYFVVYRKTVRSLKKENTNFSNATQQRYSYPAKSIS